MRVTKENALAAEIASHLQITEAQGLILVRKAGAQKMDPRALLHGETLAKVKKPASKTQPKPDIAAAKSLFDDPAPAEDAWTGVEDKPADDPVIAPTPKIVPPKRTDKKPEVVAVAKPSADMVDVGGTMIDATLTLKQKIAILARAIKSPDLDVVDLVRAIQLHTDLSGDSAEGQTYELRIVLDTTATNSATAKPATVPETLAT